MDDQFLLRFGIILLVVFVLAAGAVLLIRLRQEHWRYFSEKRVVRKRRNHRARSWSDPLGGPPKE